MPDVLRSTRTRLPALLAIAAVCGVIVLPAEHAHVATPHDDHHGTVVHRHFAPHHEPESHARVERADGDEGVRWLSVRFTLTRAAAPAAPQGRLIETLLPPAAPELKSAKVEELFVSVHAPPWTTPSGLRAPPFLS